MLFRFCRTLGRGQRIMNAIHTQYHLQERYEHSQRDLKHSPKRTLYFRILQVDYNVT